MTFRQRIKAWNDSIVGELNAFPYIVFAFYTVKIIAYILVFTHKVANPDVGLFHEDNVKRAILYNIVGDVLGLNSTGGPLGFRMKAFFVTWYNLLMPGSITCPLIPGIPAKRHVLQSVGYVAYVCSLVKALHAPGFIAFSDILPVIAILAVLTPFDLVTFQASRGEHSGYMLVCCLFPWPSALHGSVKQWPRARDRISTFKLTLGSFVLPLPRLRSMRFCQACLWFFAGTAKIGPWMKYVNAFMMPNSKLLAAIALMGVPISDWLYKDRHGAKGPPDVNPSPFLELLAKVGVIGELALGPLCLFVPAIGLPVTFCFHGYILSMVSVSGAVSARAWPY
jgi:hypothetical protein